MADTKTTTHSRDGNITGQTVTTTYPNGAEKRVERTVRSRDALGVTFKPISVTRTDPKGNSRTEKI